jgi:uncharacterized protein
MGFMNSPLSTLYHLPLYPMQGVLFPGGMTTLRVFEMRYMDVMTRSFKVGAPFGVVTYSHDWNSDDAPTHRQSQEASVEGFMDETVFAVGTLATITELHRPQPGLIAVRCTGAQRFRIMQCKRNKHGLWLANVDVMRDDMRVTVPEDLHHANEAMQQLVLSLSQRMPDEEEVPIQAPYQWNDCGWLANRWCELLPLGADVKNRLMSLDSPLLRLELVADSLSQMGFKTPLKPKA